MDAKMDYHIFYPRLVTQTPFENTKITSYGLIVLALKTERVICVQRLHSVEFLLTLMGHYRPSLIILYLPNMTAQEHQLLLELMDHDKDYFTNVYTNLIGLDQRDLNYGYLRFVESQNTIRDFLSKHTTTQELKWTWPKGRLSMEDKDDGFTCAKREFTEEVEIALPPALYQSNDCVVIDTIKTLACKTIETKCWLYVIEDEIPLPPLANHKEVSDRQWINLEEAVILLKQPHVLDNIKSHLQLMC